MAPQQPTRTTRIWSPNAEQPYEQFPFRAAASGSWRASSLSDVIPRVGATSWLEPTAPKFRRRSNRSGKNEKRPRSSLRRRLSNL